MGTRAILVWARRYLSDPRRQEREIRVFVVARAEDYLGPGVRTLDQWFMYRYLTPAGRDQATRAGMRIRQLIANEPVRVLKTDVMPHSYAQTADAVAAALEVEAEFGELASPPTSANLGYLEYAGAPNVVVVVQAEGLFEFVKRHLPMGARLPTIGPGATYAVTYRYRWGNDWREPEQVEVTVERCEEGP